MKLLGKFNTLALLAGMFLANAALAQPEQWLQYHTSREGRSYRWLDLTTNRPPNVALPKLGAKPFFAHWTNALDPKGRWLCFDRSRKSGPYDRVFIDSTGNGRLDDKSAASAIRTDPYSAFFDPIRVVFKGEDGPITYHLVVRSMSYNSDRDVRAGEPLGIHRRGRERAIHTQAGEGRIDPPGRQLPHQPVPRQPQG